MVLGVIRLERCFTGESATPMPVLCTGCNSGKALLIGLTYLFCEHEHEAPGEHWAHLIAITWASRTEPRLKSLQRFAPQKSSYDLENGPRTKIVIRILEVIRVDPRSGS